MDGFFSNEWIIKASMKHFDIPDKKILAAAVEIDSGIVTDRLIRVPSGAAKPDAIRQHIGRIPDVAFGNSRWDAEMLQMSRRAFVVNPFPDLEETGKKANWTIYWPDGMPDPDTGVHRAKTEEAGLRDMP